MFRAAEVVRTLSLDWGFREGCIGELTCDIPLVVQDFRDGATVSADVTPRGRETFVRVERPAVDGGPYPVVILGHGLNDSRSFAGRAREMFAGMDVVLVAMDAVEHGDHPDNADEGLDALSFLGIQIFPELKFDLARLRGNFDASALDRLQLVEALRANPDLDGDGIDDVDPTRMAYWGVSLGGMMGPSLLSLDDGIELGLLSVAGGRLMEFTTNTEAIEPFLPFFYDLVGGEAAFQRLASVGQTALDGADPASYASYVARDRQVGNRVPHVLMTVAVEDDTVPPSAGKALATALQLAHVGTIIEPVNGLFPGEALPASGQLDGTTWGLFQYDRVGAGSGAVPATHGNTPTSDEARLQLRRLFGSWLDGEVPEILDPYAELSTPPL